MATDIRNLNWNSTTVDVVAVQTTITALDRLGAANADGAYDAGVIPKGAIVTKTFLDVTEAFDGTTPTLSCGTSALATKWFTTGDLSSKATLVGSSALDEKEATHDAITLTLVGGGSTVGEATLYVEYVDTAARREIFTV